MKVLPNELIAVTVKGEPIPKQAFQSIRGRVTRPARVKAWQEIVGYAGLDAMRRAHRYVLLTADLSVSLHFRLSTRRRQDLDNLSKSVLDGLNKIVWVDDRQIVELHLFKVVQPSDPGVDIYVWKKGR